MNLKPMPSEKYESTQVEQWIDSQATELANLMIDLMRNDHEDHRSHDESEETYEALIRSHLRTAMQYGGEKGLEAGPITFTDKEFKKEDPPQAYPVEKAAASIARRLISDLLLALLGDPPATEKAKLIERAMKFYWNNHEQNHQAL